MAEQDEFRLNTAWELLVIDIEAGQQFASASITYRKNPEWVILHRIVGDDWIAVPLSISGPSDPALLHGDFASLKLKPGQMYEACIVPDGYHPDPGVPVHEWVVPYTSSEGPPPFVSVVAVRKRPERRHFYSDGNSRTYGTYHERDVITNTPVLAQLQLSLSKWQDLGDGLLVLPGTKHVRTRGPKITFAFEIDDLLPGTLYYELLLLTDQYGNWEFVTAEITTLKRKVTVEVTELFINDDSDDFSNGEADFHFKSYAGTPLLAQSNVISYGNSNVESGFAAVPVPSGVCTLGPAAVTAEMKRVYFWADGNENDSGSVPIDSPDYAEGSKELNVPVGTGEKVTGATGALELSGSDSWSFKVSYKYSISYQ